MLARRTRGGRREIDAMGIALVLCVVGAALEPTTRPAVASDRDVHVAPVRVEEQRVLQLQRDPLGPEPGLIVRLDVTGEPARTATHVSAVRIARAEADDGESLLPAAAEPTSAKADTPKPVGADTPTSARADQPAWRALTDFDRIGNTEGFRIDLRLRSSKRSATKIVAVDAEIEIASGGEPASATFASIGTAAGEPLEHDVLSAAGIRAGAWRSRPEAFAGPPGDPQRTVYVETAGDPRVPIELTLCDAKGEPLRLRFPPAATVATAKDGVRQWTVTAEAPLPDDVGLRIATRLHQQRWIVPIRLRNVPLP